MRTSPTEYTEKPMPDKALVPLSAKADDVRSLLTKHKSQIALALPRHLSIDRMLRVALTAINNTPKLLECTKATLFAAVIQAAQLGLEPDNTLGLCYFIPFRNTRRNQTECQFVIGYRGLLDLARRSGGLATIEARVVREGDAFDYQFGLEPQCIHIPAKGGDPTDRPITFVYAIAHLKGLTPPHDAQFDVLSRAEVERIRGRSRAGNDGPWVTDWPEMAKKTALRRLCKLLPVSVEVTRAVNLDELADAGVPQELDTLIDLPAGLDPAPASALDDLAAAAAPDPKAAK